MPIIFLLLSEILIKKSMEKLINRIILFIFVFAMVIANSGFVVLAINEFKVTNDITTIVEKDEETTKVNKVMIIYPNGVINDVDGVIYHTDGTITYADGTKKDAYGNIHYLDGSIMTADGTTYYVDGSILYVNGTKMLADGTVVKANSSKGYTEGAWNYDPTSNSYKFQTIKKDGTKVTYTDQWIQTKNAQGKETWHTVDSNGDMVTGWLKSDGEYYYLSEDVVNKGELVVGNVTIDGKTYELDFETGKLLSNNPPKDFVVMGAINHKSGEDGNWKIDLAFGVEYFMVKFKMNDGSVIEVPPSGWYMIDGFYYFFDKQGVPQKGLIIYDGKYYYMNDDGTMMEGGEKILGNKTYVFDKATGACRTIREN